MRKVLVILALVLVALVAWRAVAGLTILYENLDPTEYTGRVICGGDSREVRIAPSCMASLTLPGPAPCEVVINGVQLTVVGDERVEIRQGRPIKI